MAVAKMRAQVRTLPAVAVQEKEKFNYVIGRPPTGIWLARGIDALIIHTDGSTEVRYGTKKQAEESLADANKKTGKENFVYELVQKKTP